MTCTKTYGRNVHGMRTIEVVCDEHDFTECPKTGASGPLPRYRNQSQRQRWRGLKKIRGAYGKSQARYFGHPGILNRRVVEALSRDIRQGEITTAEPSW